MIRIVALLAFIIACTDSTDPSDVVQFRFQEEISSQILHVRISNESVVRDAEQLMQSGEPRWLIGRPVRGNGDFNTGWAWHLDPASISFAEVTIEACQSAAGVVGDDLDYWIGFGQVCIWGVVRERE